MQQSTRRHSPEHLLIFTLCTLAGIVIIFFISPRLVRAQPPPPVTAPQLASASGQQRLAMVNTGTLFQPQVKFALEDQPAAQAVGIGDFNHDGRADVAVTAGVYAPNYLFIFLQQADGQLAAPARYPADVRPEALAVGDLNGDGRDDVAVASPFSNQVTVYFQREDGTLAAREAWATQMSPDAIVVADVNNDDRADVIVSHWNHASVGVLLQQPAAVAQGDPQKALAPMLFYTAPQAGSDDIDSGDIDGDGRLDIIKANGQLIDPPNISVLRQTITGTLELPTAHNVPNKPTSRGVAVGDVTGDGRTDVVVTQIAFNSTPLYGLSIFAQAADGSLQYQETISSGYELTPVEIADIDGDGRNDIVAAASNDLMVFLQQPTGISAEYQSYPISYATRLKPQGLDVGDINSDGRADVTIANYNAGLIVLYQNPPTSTATPTAIATPTATATFVATTAPGSTATATPTINAPAASSQLVYLPLIAAAAQASLSNTPVSSLTSTPAATPTVTPSPALTPSATPGITPTIRPAVFAAATACLNEVAVWQESPVLFPYGRRLLTTSMTYYNHLGQSWRVEWTVDGVRRADLDTSGVFTQMPDQIISQLFYGTSGHCEMPLPRGIYSANIYLQNQLILAGQATIE